MSEGANAELIRRVFAEANRVVEGGGFDARMKEFREHDDAVVWVKDSQRGGS